MAPLLLDLVSHDQAEDPTDARAQSPHEPQRQPAHRAQEVGEIDAVGKAELAASQGRAGRAGVRTRSRRNCSVHPAVLTPCSRRPPRRPADATEEILREPRGSRVAAAPGLCQAAATAAADAVRVPVAGAPSAKHPAKDRSGRCDSIATHEGFAILSGPRPGEHP